MTRTEHAERLESAPLSLYALARVTNAAWPPPPQYGPPPPLPDPLPRQHPPMHRGKADRARWDGAKPGDTAIGKLRAAYATEPPAVTAAEFWLSLGERLHWEAHRVKQRAHNAGLAAKVAEVAA